MPTCFPRLQPLLDPYPHLPLPKAMRSSKESLMKRRGGSALEIICFPRYERPSRSCSNKLFLTMNIPSRRQRMYRRFSFISDLGGEGPKPIYHDNERASSYVLCVCQLIPSSLFYQNWIWVAHIFGM